MISIWGVMNGGLNVNVSERGLDDIDAVTTEKWEKLGDGHVGLSTMIHQEKV